MGWFSPVMKLTCQRATMQSFMRQSRETPCYQRRTKCSDAWCCRFSLIRIKFGLKTATYLCGSSRKALVHNSLVHSLQAVSCKEWLGRKVGQSRCGVSSTVWRRVARIAKPQVGAPQRVGYEELGRYGIDESDYANVMMSTQSAQSSDMCGKSLSNAISRSKGDKGFALKQKIHSGATKDIESTESSENARVEGSDWCAYLILSNDKQKTYLGVTANLRRRYLGCAKIHQAGRLRQHNGELVGGAKAARGGRPWSLVCTMRGFGTRSEACQFEWKLRKFSKAYLKVHETLSKEIPSHYQGSNIILRRWAAFKRVYETTDYWKHVRVEWH